VNSADTIVAIASAPGRGAIGIVRVSGSKVPQIAAGILGTLPAPRHAHRCAFLDHHRDAIDEGLALYFPAPASYTGEHVLELQGHGGALVMDLVTKRLLELGCRMARPGEFTQRAFLNAKLDLANSARTVPYGIVGGGLFLTVPLNSVGDQTISSVGLCFGGGLRYYLSSKIGLRFETKQLFTRIDNQQDHRKELLIFQSTSLGVIFAFG